MLTQAEVTDFKLLVLVNSCNLSLLHELQSILFCLVHGNRSSHIVIDYVLQFRRKSRQSLINSIFPLLTPILSLGRNICR